MAREQPNVLFVNIGWAERYDGKHRIYGNHDDIIRQNGDPMKLGEGRAFLPDKGFVRCVVGAGRVEPSSSIDVVFVARHPPTGKYEIVGIYFEPTFIYQPWTNSKRNTRTWADASTKSFLELLGNKRSAIDWPPGWSMRRWVRSWLREKGAIRFPELFKEYALLV